MVEVPTCECLFDEDGIEVVETKNDLWRHGYYRTSIHHRLSDGTFWKASYPVSTDGETNGLRDGDSDTTITQCWPTQKLVTVYVTTPPEKTI